MATLDMDHDKKIETFQTNLSSFRVRLNANKAAWGWFRAEREAVRAQVEVSRVDLDAYRVFLDRSGASLDSLHADMEAFGTEIAIALGEQEALFDKVNMAERVPPKIVTSKLTTSEVTSSELETCAHPKLSLMGLPAELRVMIIQSFFTHHPPVIRMQAIAEGENQRIRCRPSRRVRCLRLLLVCRQLTNEAYPLLSYNLRLRLHAGFRRQFVAHTIEHLPLKFKDRIGHLKFERDVPRLDDFTVLGNLHTVTFSTLPSSLYVRKIVPCMKDILYFNESSVQGVAVVVRSEQSMLARGDDELTTKTVQNLMHLIRKYQHGCVPNKVDVRTKIWLCFQKDDGKIFGSTGHRTWSSAQNRFVNRESPRARGLRPVAVSKRWLYWPLNGQYRRHYDRLDFAAEEERVVDLALRMDYSSLGADILICVWICIQSILASCLLFGVGCRIQWL